MIYADNAATTRMSDAAIETMVTPARESFETFGCGSAIASSSMATELIKGKPVSEAMKLTNKAVAEALDGLPDYKMHCSVLAEEAIQSALDDYNSKKKETEK